MAQPENVAIPADAPNPNTQLYLGSASPRRRALLSQVGLEFFALVADVDETPQQGELPHQTVARLARAKAHAVTERIRELGFPTRPVLGADTVVVLDDYVLGKPRDANHARETLLQLSGRTHEVMTALALVTDATVHEALSVSRVSFKELEPAEIDAYWASGEPRDKAGAYAIQGLGSAFVRVIEGSYTGVVGLPLFELRQLLLRSGIDWL